MKNQVELGENQSTELVCVVNKWRH